jgi:hypothetical protein
MPQRAMSTIMVVAGCVLALAFVIVGVDLAAAAQRGPRWRRRLLGAGLVMLVALGFAPATPTQAATSPAAIAAPAKDSLAENTLWKRIMAAWQEAEEVASGKRGDYPFDEKGQKAMLQSLATSDADLKGLVEKGTLAAAEADLLREDLKGLVTSVQNKRPTEMRMATCYEPVAIEIPVAASFYRLSARLPLIKQLATTATLHPEAVRIILATLDTDLAQLDEPGAIDKIKIPEVQAAARKLRESARPEIEAIRLRVNPKVSLEKTPQWQRLLVTWKEAETAAAKDKIDVNDQGRLLVAIEQVRGDLDTLRQVGLLSDAEVQFLQSGIQDFGQPIYQKMASGKLNPETPSMMFTCYDSPRALPPPENSLHGLSERLPILESLMAAGQLHPTAVERILATCETDLKNLLDLKTESDKEKAAKIAPAVRTAIEKIREKLKAAPAAGKQEK